MKKLFLSLACLAIIVFSTMTLHDYFLHESATLATSSSDPIDDTAESQSWSTGKEMPTPRSELSAASLGPIIYTVGGRDHTGNITDIVETYDPRNDLWSTIDSLPLPLDHVAVAAYDNKLYVVGGFYIDENGTTKASDKLFIYDPVSKKWQEGAPMPSPRAALTAAFIDGILYAVGGDHDWESWPTNLAFDPSTNKWDEKAPMPTPRHHLASSVVDGKLYVIGGRYTNRTSNYNLDVNEVYNPKSDSWNSLEPMPTKRSGLAAAPSSPVDGDIYVFGGEYPFHHNTSDTTYDVTEKYNPQTNKWTTEQPMPSARHGFACVIDTNRIYLLGGGPEPGMSVTGVNEIYEVPPSLHTSSFRAEVISQGLYRPTNMAFLAPDDILVLEKDVGLVRRIVNGMMLEGPILDVSVANKGDRGLLGIAVSKNYEVTNTTATNGSSYVFLYYSEADGQNDSKYEPLGNRLYRYEMKDNKLVNPKLLLNLPTSPGPQENSGNIIIGPDSNLYLTVGDMSGSHGKKLTKAQNYENGPEPDGRAGILRITQDGEAVGKGIFGNTYPLNLYYAYGIRNSFGMDFDPVTGKLWDTENGPTFGDEINLVYPGFNSGWKKVQGLWKVNEFWKSNPDGNTKGDRQLHGDSNLVDFDGKGIYSSPEFTWDSTVLPTELKFFNSDKYGIEYKNDLFVADFKDGEIFHFDLNEDRTELLLNGSLADRVANSSDEEMLLKRFGDDFGGITDLEVGPDGYLYVLSYVSGTIFRIIPDI